MNENTSEITVKTGLENQQQGETTPVIKRMQQLGQRFNVSKIDTRTLNYIDEYATLKQDRDQDGLTTMVMNLKEGFIIKHINSSGKMEYTTQLHINPDSKSLTHSILSKKLVLIGGDGSVEELIIMKKGDATKEMEDATIQRMEANRRKVDEGARQYITFNEYMDTINVYERYGTGSRLAGTFNLNEIERVVGSKEGKGSGAPYVITVEFYNGGKAIITPEERDRDTGSYGE